MQQTSLMAYKQIQPKISHRKRLILGVLKQSEGMTGYEIARELGFYDPNTVRPRLNELYKEGIIIDICIRVCSITGKKAKVWKETCLF